MTNCLYRWIIVSLDWVKWFGKSDTTDLTSFKTIFASVCGVFSSQIPQGSTNTECILQVNSSLLYARLRWFNTLVYFLKRLRYYRGHPTDRKLKQIGRRTNHFRFTLMRTKSEVFESSRLFLSILVKNSNNILSAWSVDISLLLFTASCRFLMNLWQKPTVLVFSVSFWSHRVSS